MNQKFFNSISTSKCFVLFELFFWLRLFNLVSKYVFVTKFACANPASKNSPESLLNSGVVIYLSWLWSVSLFSISLIFVSQSKYCLDIDNLDIA